MLARYFEENANPKNNPKTWHQLPPLLNCLKSMITVVRAVNDKSGLTAKAAARKMELNLLYDQQLLGMVVTQLRDYNPSRCISTKHAHG